MSHASRRTWHTQHVGYLHLTVEAEPLAAELAHESTGGGQTEIAKRLVDILDEHRLPATWAVGDPAHSAATALVTRSPIPHEFALLGDHHWLGPTAGRTRFARELARRVVQARAKGIEVATIVPRVAPIAEHIDLVVKHGLRAVVDSPAKAGGTRALHYGVWEFAPTERLPFESSWLVAGWRLYRRIRHAALDRASFHLMIDAPAIAAEGRWALRSLAKLARRVAVLRDRGLLCVETLGAAAARLSDVPAVTPQQSILRRAA